MIRDVSGNKHHNGDFLLQKSWRGSPGGKGLGIGNGVHAHYFNKVGKAVCTVRTASPNSEAKIHDT